MALDPQKYVDMGRLMVPKRDPSWKKDVKKANRRKNGRPFTYCDKLFVMLAVARTLTKAPYRQLEGMCMELLGEKDAPDHSTIHARINSLDVSFQGTKLALVKAKGGGMIRIAIDSSGLTPTKRGESIQHKWNVTRGYSKLHIAVDASSGMILSAKITDDGRGSGDALHLEELLDGALENVEMEPGTEVELLGDGAYGSRRNIAACKRRGVVSKLRINVLSTTSGKGAGYAWGDYVRDQLGSNGEVNSLTKEERRQNQKKWMKEAGYGKRWSVEAAFSSFKRLQGEALWSRKVKYMMQEIKIRVAVHNLIVRMGVNA